jgi:hypothetical protein
VHACGEGGRSYAKKKERGPFAGKSSSAFPISTMRNFGAQQPKFAELPAQLQIRHGAVHQLVLL